MALPPNALFFRKVSPLTNSIFPLLQIATNSIILYSAKDVNEDMDIICANGLIITKILLTYLTFGGVFYIFEAERERNKQEIELSDLKGLARLTKKKELESRIAIKNEEIRTLKARLSGIVRQHGFATVQDFYTAFYTARHATEAYQKECAKWEEAYGEKATPKAETMHEKIQRYKEKADGQNTNQPYQHRDKGAR